MTRTALAGAAALLTTAALTQPLPSFDRANMRRQADR
jgi:hypothetical protein